MSLTFGNDLGGVLIGIFLFIIGYACRFRKKQRSLYKWAVLLLLCIYIAMVIGVTLTPIPLDVTTAQNMVRIYQDVQYYNLIPFNEVFQHPDQFILNIILFVPFGILWTLYHDRMSFKRMLCAGFVFSLLIEVAQLGLSFLFHGPAWYFDVNDLIANTLGAMIGYLMVKLLVIPLFSLVRKQRT